MYFNIFPVDYLSFKRHIKFMSLRSILTGISEYHTPHIEFPNPPKIILVEGIEAYEYISPEDLNKLVTEYSRHENLRKFKKVFYNLNGGKGFAEKLAAEQGYPFENMIPCEYHPDGRCPIRIQEEYKDENIAVVEDVQDTRRTTSLIRLDAPKAKMKFLTRKLIPGQIIIPNSDCVVEVENRWIFGGWSMNGDVDGDGYPENWGCSYGGIGVKKIQ